jgi:rod shape determining protein RodA
MRSRSLFGFDILLFAATLALMVVGVLFIYSSGTSSTGIVMSNEYIKQIVWVSVGLVILLTILFTDYARIGEYSLYIYLAFVALLVGTLFFGRVVNGARSWIPLFGFGIQPSEFAKIGTVLYLARYFSTTRNSQSELKRFLIAFAIAAVPMLLVLGQPDMGTALVFLPILLVMSYIAGIRTRYLMYVLMTGATLILLSVLPAWETYIVEREIGVVGLLTDQNYALPGMIIMVVLIGLSALGYFILKRGYFYWLVYAFSSISISFLGSFFMRLGLKDYQIKRLIVFLDPGIDPQGAGWNVIQSVTAVGSGGFWGKGWLKGTQSHYRYLPQQSTDFIFSIIAEEWGFLGGLVIFLLFLVILFRGLAIVLAAKDDYAANIAGGIVGMIGFHVFINMGMAMGIMPITGIPLFFLSYGGSSLLTGLIGIGLLLNIHIRRYHY